MRHLLILFLIACSEPEYCYTCIQNFYSYDNRFNSTNLQPTSSLEISKCNLTKDEFKAWQSSIHFYNVSGNITTYSREICTKK